MKAFDWTRARKAKLRKMRDDGIAMVVIGKHFGLSEGAVRHAVQRFDLPRRQSGRYPKGSKAGLVQMRDVAVAVPRTAKPIAKPGKPLCRWPTGNPAREMHICCRVPETGDIRCDYAA